jgi:hypothetical protein
MRSAKVNVMRSAKVSKVWNHLLANLRSFVQRSDSGSGMSKILQQGKELLARSSKVAGWKIVLPLLRFRAKRRVPRLRKGEVTIVTVNWNSWPYLEVLLRTVKRLSPAGTKILVIDNRSKDESRAKLAGLPGVKTVKLPLNMGHDFGLDLGFLLVDTEYVIALDVDAFPLREGWIDDLLAPLSEGKELSGARVYRQFVHPCLLGMRTARFVEQGHSFQMHYVPATEDHDMSGDVGEEMSEAEAGRLHFIETTSRRGPGDVGTVLGDLVYHNFYSTRFGGTPAETLDGAVNRDDPTTAWHEALERYEV